MRSIRTIMSAALLGCSLAACAGTEGVEKRDAGTNPPAQMAEAVSPGDGSPSTTEEGDISSRAVRQGDPCLRSPEANCRNRLNQLREFKKELTNPTMTPVIPPVPANGGRCVINVTGPSYRHTEIQLWVVTGQATMQPTIGKRYDIQWTTTGSGQNSGATWGISGAKAIHFIARTIASGAWQISQEEPMFVIPNGYAGVATTGTAFGYGAPEFMYGYIQQQTNMTPIVSGRLFMVGPGKEVSTWGYQSGTATGTIDCGWSLLTVP